MQKKARHPNLELTKGNQDQSMDIYSIAIKKGKYAIKTWKTENVGQREPVVVPSSVRVQYFNPSVFDELMHSDWFGRTKTRYSVLHDPTKSTKSTSTPSEVEVNDAEETEVSEVDGLRATLDEMGVKYHHKAGVEKLQELIKNNK